MRFYTITIWITGLMNLSVLACQCPVIQWTKEVANQYDVIGRMRLIRIIPHQNNFTVAETEVLNLFKGQPSKQYKVLFPEDDDCVIPLQAGEEWLIYGKNKQLYSCEIDWCGLSRKKFANDIEDFFIATHIITYEEEFQRLQNHFPEIRITDNKQYVSHKNIIPEKYELYIYLLLSFIGFLVILQLVKKYLR